MRSRLLLFAACSAAVIAICFAAPADAGLRAGGAVLPRTQGDIVIPPEWAGIWSSIDTTYSCAGVRQSVDASLDTLCAGTVVLTNEGSPFTFVCTGTSTATTVDMTCIYSGEIVTDCNMTITIVMQGTRTAESYVINNTVTTVYSGVAPECSFFPDDCTRTVTRGTRIEPEPAAYCALPVDATTWGRVKSRYR